jgi:hypothetical protein
MPKVSLTVLMGLTLVQVAVGSLIAALTVSAVMAAASPPASHTVLVGPGFSDVSPHQLVRTSANVLYALAPTCDSYPDCPGNSLRVYRADQPGTPASFTEQDAAHRPAAVGSVAVALDASDTIHVLWNDRSGNLNYATFSTATDTWGAATTLAATNWTDFGQGDEGVALALDSGGTPHAVWSAKTADGVLHLFYANRAANWAPQQIDDVVLIGNRRTMHPALAFRPDDTLLLAWLEGTFNYVPDGAIHTRARSSAGIWGATQTIADPDGVMTTIDNGPSLLVTPDGTAHLAFVAATPPDLIRYWYDSGTGWLGDQQPPAQITHDPSLGPDGSGGVFIYGHGTPAPTYQDHGDNLYSFHKPGGASAWGPWTLYATGSFDSSVSTRWAQFFHSFPATLDIAYWADPYPNILYVGSDIALTAPAANLAFTGFPSSTAAGTPQPFTLTAQDAIANIVTGYVGTVHFTSSDPFAALPRDYTFTDTDHGVHTFSAIFNTAGAQSLTASDTATRGITGTQTGIAVNPVLTNISPTSGPVSGGTRVTLTGAGFTNGASVIFDTATAANVQVFNTTTITATTPPHMADAVNVKIAIAGSATAVLPGAYTYGDVPNPLPVLRPTAPLVGATKAAPLPSLRPSAPTNLVSTPNPLPPPR